MAVRPTCSTEVERLAAAIAAALPGQGSQYHAQMAAEADIDLRRVRAARVKLIEQAARDAATFAVKPGIDLELLQELRQAYDLNAAAEISAELVTDLLPFAADIEKKVAHYERSELFRRSRPTPDEPDRPAIAFATLVSRLKGYGRYESRAWSRRKKALRAMSAG